MKRTYVTPTMVSEEFVADQYVAACYKIHCNVGYGDGWVENGKQSGLQTSGPNKDTEIVENMSGCGIWQTVVMELGFTPTKGYWVSGSRVQDATYFYARVSGWNRSSHHFSDTGYEPVANASTSN